MWEKIRVVFTIPELRQKILLTLLFLAIYRIGWQIPLPVINAEAMQAKSEDPDNALGTLLDKVAIFSASQLRMATIFGLGIMPYISASIIFQLLASVWKPLEELKKEGEAGQKKINEYTRYATVAICVVQSWFYVASLNHPEFLNPAVAPDGYMPWSWQLVAVLTMTAGTIFLMWLGEQIDEYGIGNGISLLIMAGIVAQMPRAVKWIKDDTTIALGGSPGKPGIEVVILLLIMLVAVVAGVVFITLGQRRIPTQSAKHVRGRRVYGGTRQYLPIRVNQAGVMPIIFASSLLLIPAALCSALQQATSPPWSTFWASANNVFSSPSSFLHTLMYVGLIYFFCYFWTAITFNPKEMSENLKNYGTFIPGYRPGKRTADYLEKVMVRITYVGAGFLALVAIVPTLLYSWLHVPYDVTQFYGGTGLLIAVSVAFDLVQKIDSHLVMRNYKGLLERG
jgi:preprotein translocase subunit SecY